MWPCLMSPVPGPTHGFDLRMAKQPSSAVGSGSETWWVLSREGSLSLWSVETKCNSEENQDWQGDRCGRPCRLPRREPPQYPPPLSGPLSGEGHKVPTNRTDVTSSFPPATSRPSGDPGSTGKTSSSFSLPLSRAGQGGANG